MSPRRSARVRKPPQGREATAGNGSEDENAAMEVEEAAAPQPKTAAAAAGRGGAMRKRKTAAKAEEVSDDDWADDGKKKNEGGRKDGASKTPKGAKKPKKSAVMIYERERKKRDWKREAELRVMDQWEKRAVQMEADLVAVESGKKKGEEGPKRRNVPEITRFLVERRAKNLTREMTEEETTSLEEELREQMKKNGLRFARKKPKWNRENQESSMNQNLRDQFDDVHRDSDGEEDYNETGECDCCMGNWADMGVYGMLECMFTPRWMRQRMEPIEEKEEEETEEEVKRRVTRLQNSVNKTLQHRFEQVQKVHIILYGAHLHRLASIAVSKTSVYDEIPLAALALSMLPEGIEDLEKWWTDQFHFVPSDRQREEEQREEERMSEKMAGRKYGTQREAAVMFFSLAAAAGRKTRIVCRCEVKSRRVPKTSSTNAAGFTTAIQLSKEEGPITDEYWCEVYVEESKEWSPVYPFHSPNDDLNKNEYSVAHRPISPCTPESGRVIYILAIDNDLNLSDVSSSYLDKSCLHSPEWKEERANDKWMKGIFEEKTWAPEHLERVEEIREGELPVTINAYKNHVKFVLERDIGNSHAIYPLDEKPIGEVKGQKIFLRKFLRPLRTDKWYEKMGRIVKKSTRPCKTKSVLNPRTGVILREGLYGYWQTEKWKNSQKYNGRLPRSSFGTILMYQPADMCPEGAIYLQSDTVKTVAKDQKKDFVPAVVGWTHSNGRGEPIKRGAIYHKSDLADLIRGFKAEKEREKRYGKRPPTPPPQRYYPNNFDYDPWDLY